MAAPGSPLPRPEETVRCTEAAGAGQPRQPRRGLRVPRAVASARGTPVLRESLHCAAAIWAALPTYL